MGGNYLFHLNAIKRINWKNSRIIIEMERVVEVGKGETSEESFYIIKFKSVTFIDCLITSSPASYLR